MFGDEAERDRSEDLAARGGRLLRAAEVAFQVGRREALYRLLQEVESIPLDTSERTRLAWLRETLLANSWSGSHQVAGFVDVANQLRVGRDTDRALDALHAVAMRCWWSNPGPQTRAIVRSAAELIEVPTEDPRLTSVPAFAAPVEYGALVIKLLGRTATEASDPEQLHLLGTAAAAVGAFDQAAPLLISAAAGLRAQGRLGLLVHTLVAESWTRFNLGRQDIGRSAAAEAELLATETGQPLWTAPEWGSRAAPPLWRSRAAG